MDKLDEPRTVGEYLTDCGIECVPVDAREPGDIPVGTALLPGWVEVPPEVFPSAYQVLVNEANTKNGWAPNAVLLHGHMSGHIDVEKLLACAFVDSRRLPSWEESQTSTADFLGRRSAFISGSYVVDTDAGVSLTLEATTRYVVSETDSGQYVTQLTVTILSSQHEDLEIDVTVMNLALTIGAS